MLKSMAYNHYGANNALIWFYVFWMIMANGFNSLVLPPCQGKKNIMFPLVV